jgi:hypothetical protein
MRRGHFTGNTEEEHHSLFICYHCGNLAPALIVVSAIRQKI